jgi:hypothetical protein
MRPTFKHVVRTAGAAALLACSLALPSARAAGALFDRLLPRLRATGVPVLLPTGLHGVYADLAQALPGYYEVSLAYTPHCGANACAYGAVVGQRGAHPPRGADGTLTLTGAKVALARDYTGYFVPFGCGASCGDSTLTWAEGAYRYQIALHAGAKRDAVRLANTAIMAGPR